MCSDDAYQIIESVLSVGKYKGNMYMYLFNL